MDVRFQGKSSRVADISGMTESDPGCVKTHTSAKCRKHNSPARHRTSRVQYDLTLRGAIARRYFYVWRDRWSFRTAKTLNRHKKRILVRCTLGRTGRHTADKADYRHGR